MSDIHSTNRGRLAVQARGEDTRRRILESALDLFASHGYEGASTRLIAESAGVNLPAIQYYFGNKEGLFRAIIEDLIADSDRHLSDVAPRVRAALENRDATPAELTERLCDLLESFVTLVTGGRQVESRRRFFARAEVEEAPGLDLLHASGMQRIFNPCLGLLSRIHGKPETDPEMALRTMALVGQVVIFCNSSKRPILVDAGMDPESIRLMRLVVREHTQAICRAALAVAAP